MMIKELLPVVVKSGETAVFECQIVNAEVVEWYYDEMQIVDAEGTEIAYESDGATRLLIENVCVEDEGDYSVKAINPDGAISRTVTLRVAGNSAIFVLCSRWCWMGRRSIRIEFSTFM